ncbi:MAG: hypothetical protein AAGK04_03505 [Planctomycetota bacterium]
MRTEAYPVSTDGSGGSARRGRRRASRPRVGRFEHAAIGPLQLRVALRDRLEPGERLVGFGVGSRVVRPGDAARSMAAGLVPLVGQVLLLIEGARHQHARRVYVLTDRRLLAVRPDRRGRRPDSAVDFETPLASLRVRAFGRKGRRPPRRDVVLGRTSEPPIRFELLADGYPPRAVQFKKGRGRRAEARLRQGLWTISE